MTKYLAYQLIAIVLVAMGLAAYQSAQDIWRVGALTRTHFVELAIYVFVAYLALVEWRRVSGKDGKE